MTRAAASARGGHPVRAVLFDYGLTLVTYERPVAALQRAYAAIAALLAERAGATPTTADELLSSVHDRVEDVVRRHEESRDLREIDIVAVHARAYADAGHALDREVLDEVARLEQEAWWEGMRLGPHTVEVLTELRGRGLRVGLCSNAPYRPASMRAQVRHLGLDRLLHAVTFSGEVGWRKPSPRMYAAALAALGADPATTVMVGDRVREDVGGAREAGLGAIRTREFFDDPTPAGDHPVIDRLADLPDLLVSGEW